MEKLTWRLSEVIGFLESQIKHEEATEYEEKLYEDYKWNGKMDTKCREFKMVLRNMNRKWNEG